MTEKSDRWKNREWYASSKTRWLQPAGSSAGQSSVDTWEHLKPRGKWIEVTADYRVLDVLVKEKKATWAKGGRDSAKREAELYDMLEKQLQMKRKKKGTGLSLVTSNKLFSKGKKQKISPRSHGRNGGKRGNRTTKKL